MSGWRSILDISGGWGQLVAVAMEIDNLHPALDGPISERWAALQSDAVIYIDDSRSASVSGTGLEDYFGYAHGFTGAENTSSAFVGVPHASPRRPEPLTWHCYRHHIIDPVYFQHRLRFLMEGTDPDKSAYRVPGLTYESHRRRVLQADIPVTSFAHTAFYYFRPDLNPDPCDRVDLGNKTSEAHHSFQVLQCSRSSSPDSCGHSFFTGPEIRFFGDTATNDTFSLEGRSFDSGDVFKFILRVNPKDNRTSYSLRRTFQWPVEGSTKTRPWNSRGKVTVNNYTVEWFVPFGSLSKQYSLQMESVMLTSNSNSIGVFEITVEPLSEFPWLDIAYELCPT